ncbi:MAG: HAD family hydrolase, partial [Bacteroides stercoris]|nr:HAD family hydrolase [Bacteroides stercoris]
MTDKIEVVAFDADDTLWENELYFQEFERKFCDLLKAYQPSATVSQELFKTEMKNLHMYGYGLKSMMLSMIETACRITDGTENMHCVEEIIKLGQELLQKPVTLLDGVEDVLLQLQGKYKLVLATKGDLFDQRRKVMSSGLMKYFCHVEIMS